MANAKVKEVANKKVATKEVAPKKPQEEKTMVKEVKTQEVKSTEKKVANKEKQAKPVVLQMSNSEMKQLFIQNGCATYTNANDSSKVVYNTFGTKSRVLQQGRAYQLLLTNGHKMVKEQVVDCDNNDAERFVKWYEKLSDEDKKMVIGFSEMMSTKLSLSEMPREKSVKIASYELLVKFLKFMGSFDENKVAQPIAQ